MPTILAPTGMFIPVASAILPISRLLSSFRSSSFLKSNLKSLPSSVPVIRKSRSLPPASFASSSGSFAPILAPSQYE
ncbi:MAG: hypothetical protein Q6373_012610 [Candidatus Sigynarchaeota archaeon]